MTRINLTDLKHAPVNSATLQKGITGDSTQTEKKTLIPHQTEAVSSRTLLIIFRDCIPQILGFSGIIFPVYQEEIAFNVLI